jgi:hypothetical protein
MGYLSTRYPECEIVGEGEMLAQISAGSDEHIGESLLDLF